MGNQFEVRLFPLRLSYGRPQWSETFAFAIKLWEITMSETFPFMI